MTFIFVTTDDLCPENMDLWSHWERLKKSHPRLKITAFVPARFHNKSSNDVISNRDFWKWYKENKSWVEIAAHGLVHTLPPEFTKFTQHQVRIVEKMTTKLRRYFPKYKGFKAPYYRMNDVTINTVAKAGYSYIAHWNTIFFLTPIKPAAPQFMMMHTHTNMIDKKGDKYANKDNINLIRDIVNKKLKKYEKRGITYLRINDYIERFKE